MLIHFTCMQMDVLAENGAMMVRIATRMILSIGGSKGSPQAKNRKRIVRVGELAVAVPDRVNGAACRGSRPATVVRHSRTSPAYRVRQGDRALPTQATGRANKGQRGARARRQAVGRGGWRLAEVAAPGIKHPASLASNSQ